MLHDIIQPVVRKFTQRGIEQIIEGVERSIFTSVTKEGDVNSDLESGKIPQRF